MDLDKVNEIQSKIKFDTLWNYREHYDMFSIIKINYMNNDINIHEFILSDYFGTFKILKKDFIVCDKFKKLEFSSSIMSDDYHLEYKYFELILKYFYGHKCSLENILLNDLCKVHAFLIKHYMKDKNTDLITMVENKIHHVVYNLPIINIYGGMNSCDTCEIDYNILIKKDDAITIINKYEHCLFNAVTNMDYCEWDGNIKRKECETTTHEIYHIYDDELFCEKINDLNDLFKEYDEYLIDDQIYDYALSLIFKKYNLDNEKYTFTLPDGIIRIEETDDESQIMHKLRYYNLMKHKYYTLSFLNKNFIKINMDDVLNGKYNKYTYSENIYTKHAIFECAKLQQHNECDKEKATT